MHKVMIHPADYDHCRDAVNKAFELFPLELKGKKVLIKPNTLRSSTPEEHIVTNPAVLRAVVEKVEEYQPAQITVGDNPGLHSYGANEESFRRTGLMEAAKGYYRNIGHEAVEMDFPSRFKDRVGVSRAVMEADVVISVPKFKTHGLTIITGAIKNSYGILPGAQKANLHRLAGSPAGFNELIVDVFSLRVPDLFIVDAVVGMEGNGPASTELRDIGLILAADNAVALDSVIARMMGLNPSSVLFLQTALKRGLGETAAEAIEIIGRLEPIPDFKPPPAAAAFESLPAQVQEMFQARLTQRPKADPDKCTGCQTCLEQCPVQAISMEQNLPVVKVDTCITCFCCQEVCPEQAITLQ